MLGRGWRLSFTKNVYLAVEQSEIHNWYLTCGTYCIYEYCTINHAHVIAFHVAKRDEKFCDKKCIFVQTIGYIRDLASI